MRVAVFGGTFDPPHIGHLFGALCVGHELRLDRVLMVVANDPWQKSGGGQREVTPASQRLAMLQLAVAEVPALEPSSIELDRGGASYSADTLETVHDTYTTPAGPPEIFLVVGSDAAAGLGTWKRTEVLRKLATTVVLERPGKGAGGRPPSGWEYELVMLPELEVSGTKIRERVAAGKPIDFLTERPVITYINNNYLYRTKSP